MKKENSGIVELSQKEALECTGGSWLTDLFDETEEFLGDFFKEDWFGTGKDEDGA